MNRHEDLVESELEGQLRTAFAADAARAPLPDGLAAGAVRVGRAHRRRTAAVTAALAVAALVGGVTVVQQLGPAATPGPPAATPTPAPTQPAVDPSGSVLMFRGVEVPVPPSMLASDNVKCGIPVADAAYVTDPALPIEACLPHPAHPERLTEVVLQPVTSVPDEDRLAGETVLPDGRTRVASAIPQGGVWLSVTSPDPDRARELMNGVLVVDRVDGCPVQPAPVPPPADSTLVDFQLGARDGGVCGYRDGWLVGARLLTPAEAADLNDLLHAAPPSGVVNCFNVGAAKPQSGWWLSLNGEHTWVDGGRNCNGTWSAGGGSHQLTTSLVSALWKLAAGPASFDNLAP